MRSTSLIILLFLLPIGLSAESLQLKVQGMVCALCAQGIEKNFKKEANVKSVTVSLENKMVEVETAAGTTIPDAKLKSIIESAGLNLENVTRKN